MLLALTVKANNVKCDATLLLAAILITHRQIGSITSHVMYQNQPHSVALSLEKLRLRRRTFGGVFDQGRNKTDG